MAKSDKPHAPAPVTPAPVEVKTPIAAGGSKLPTDVAESEEFGRMDSPTDLPTSTPVSPSGSGPLKPEGDGEPGTINPPPFTSLSDGERTLAITADELREFAEWKEGKSPALPGVVAKVQRLGADGAEMSIREAVELVEALITAIKNRRFTDVFAPIGKLWQIVDELMESGPIPVGSAAARVTAKTPRTADVWLTKEREWAACKDECVAMAGTFAAPDHEWSRPALSSGAAAPLAAHAKAPEPQRLAAPAITPGQWMEIISAASAVIQLIGQFIKNRRQQ